jgi:hypothetical protein
MLDNSLQRARDAFLQIGTFWSDVDGLFSRNGKIYIMRRCAAPFFAKSTLCNAQSMQPERVQSGEVELLQYDTFCVLSHLKVNTPVTSGGRKNV